MDFPRGTWPETLQLPQQQWLHIRKDGPGPGSPREGDDPTRIFGLSYPGFFICLVTSLSYPLSRGSVHVQSANLEDVPVINYGILRHPVDLNLHVRHSMSLGWTSLQRLNRWRRYFRKG
jgi:hypothetical protein